MVGLPPTALPPVPQLVLANNTSLISNSLTMILFQRIWKADTKKREKITYDNTISFRVSHTPRYGHPMTSRSHLGFLRHGAMGTL